MPQYITPEPPFTLPDTELTRHPERSVRVNRIASVLTVLGSSALLGLIAANVISIVYVLVTDSNDWHDTLAWWDPAMTLTCLIPAAVCAWRWNRIKAAWHFRGYHLGDEELHIRTGLLTRKLTGLAYSRIQSVTVHSGPIQRRFNLATLTIQTAAGSDTIEDLDPQVAHDLHSRLTELGRVRGPLV
ncbi:PH domain-containing protein [Streptomyces sp. NBC_01237]|uniref:PH domain-containing protein n=1 Tax=Streptomyces sp. NBC_01237 TaxID=2903790 RepID=UPI002DDA39A7|nr:PH domain-containing protein [Streptomyces sp. NBC_01237]WRZ77211.1 PH domain-containing protein [Streptomyces sp. NBC_01237]